MAAKLKVPYSFMLLKLTKLEIILWAYIAMHPGIPLVMKDAYAWYSPDTKHAPGDVTKALVKLGKKGLLIPISPEERLYAVALPQYMRGETMRITLNDLRLLTKSEVALLLCFEYFGVDIPRYQQVEITGYDPGVLLDAEYRLRELHFIK